MLGYLDPGSGSVIVAAIVAGVAGIGVFFKMLWQRVRHPFGGRKHAEDAAGETAGETTDAESGADRDVDSGAELRAGGQGAEQGA